VKILNQIELLW